MPRNVFDQAARHAAKLDAAAFIGWLLGRPPAAFVGWLDTRAVPVPGDADLTNDTVARLADPDAGGVPWAVPIEFQIEPDPLMFGRTLRYLGDLWLSAKPDDERGSRFLVGAAVVNLSGRGNASRRMEWPAAGLTTHLQVVERNLPDESAEELLAEVESGRRSLALLAWVPLMTGGGDSGIIDRWKAAAQTEPDARRRSSLGVVALVFADAADRKSIWKKALEGWNMRESSVVNEWIAEARVEARAEGRAEGEARGEARGEAMGQITTLIGFLEARFGQVPADLEGAIRQTTDPTRLKTWVPLAARAATLAEFRAAAGV